MKRKFKRYVKADQNTISPIQGLLQDSMLTIEKTYLQKPNRILEKWPEIIGEKLAPMTEAVAFKNKVLYVRVKSSTLYSLLCKHEKQKLLNILQDIFTKETIEDIRFTIR